MILQIVNDYIPFNKIKAKNHKQYIFQILSKEGAKFGQKGPFLNFRLQKLYTRLSTQN